jgi:lipopolysaccharide biosynthesis glycosyltransferase
MSNIPVFLASDNNYAPFVATTIASTCDNTNSFIEFYILDGGITKQNQEKICSLKNKFTNFSIEFIPLDLDKEFPDFKETANITKSMYSRFLIPTLKPMLNKVIYSDVDVIMLDDIAKMYSEELNGYAVGAVWEEYAEASYNIIRKNNLELKNNHKYFCSGHLLINCNKWLEENVLEKLNKIATEYKNILTCPDQDVLNKYFDSNYKILDKKYSYINQNFYFFDKIDNIVIRHYNGKTKPWHISPDSNIESFIPNHKDFWHYAKMTDFYDELYSKTQNKTEQDKIIRHLRIANMARKLANG